jgi:hypothetical protein
MPEGEICYNKNHKGRAFIFIIPWPFFITLFCFTWQTPMIGKEEPCQGDKRLTGFLTSSLDKKKRAPLVLQGCFLNPNYVTTTNLYELIYCFPLSGFKAPGGS